MKKHGQQWKNLKAALNKRLDRLGGEVAKHENVVHAKGTPVDSLFFAVAEAHVTQTDGQGKDPQEELLWEDPHTDGAAGMVHCGLSGYTHRLLKVWTAGVKNKLTGMEFHRG